MKPSPIIPFTLENIIFSGLVLIITAGFLEELIFRGLIQRNSEIVFGKFQGLLFSTFLFMLMHLSFKSPLLLLLVFFIGIFYGSIFQKTRNLLGISLSHGLGNVIFFVIAPLLLG